MAWYSSSDSVLRRWSAVSERPMPDEGFAGFADKFVNESFQIRLADAELVSILDGTCTAELKADVLAGKWSPVRRTDEQQAEAKRQAATQELFDSKPFETGNLTAQMQLRQLNPELAAQEEANALQQSGRAGHTEKELLQMQAAQKEARHNSLLKGLAMAQGETNMRLRRESLLRQHRGDINAGQVRR